MCIFFWKNKNFGMNRNIKVHTQASCKRLRTSQSNGLGAGQSNKQTIITCDSTLIKSTEKKINKWSFRAKTKKKVKKTSSFRKRNKFPGGEKKYLLTHLVLIPAP